MARSGEQGGLGRARIRAGAILLLGLAAGCEGAPEKAASKRFACTCAFLTDTDGASSLSLQVCAAPEARDDAARGCAQTAAPATVERCDCQATEGACDGDLCTVLERAE